MKTNALITSKILLVVAGCFLLVSCFSGKKSIKDDGRQIPPDFGKKEGTLLVVKGRTRGWNRRLTDHMEENYSGKYEFITREDLGSKRYDDKVKYRFAFGEEIATVRDRPGAGPNTNLNTSTGAYFATMDRMSGEIYKTTD